jgi:hypothetical protein
LADGIGLALQTGIGPKNDGAVNDTLDIEATTGKHNRGPGSPAMSAATAAASCVVGSGR